MKSRLYSPLFASAGLAVALVTGARAEEPANIIKFSDPAKPGTVKISLGRGELRIQGADTNEVSVKSDAKPASSKPRKDGLRELSATSSFSLKESDNVVVLDAAAQTWGGKGNSDFQLTVPRSTTIIVQNGWGGDITCAGVSGDIEINSMHGEIKLDDIAGGVVVGTMNGEIRASIRELHEGKPLSFTSMNGEVHLRVPENAKANVRLRTQNGSVLTDFEESALITKIENTAGVSRSKTAVAYRGNKVLTVEIQDAIREATQLSATAVREALEAVKDGIEAARLNSDDARRQVEDAKRDLERARREMERDRTNAERRLAESRGRRSVDAANPPQPAAPPALAAPAAPAAPVMPKISAPTISGGKLVTGTINGGGPEISVSTMNGDVILRKLTAKP